jgi:hypothetical protein
MEHLLAFREKNQVVASTKKSGDCGFPSDADDSESASPTIEGAC